MPGTPIRGRAANCTNFATCRRSALSPHFRADDNGEGTRTNRGQDVCATISLDEPMLLTTRTDLTWSEEVFFWFFVAVVREGRLFQTAWDVQSGSRRHSMLYLARRHAAR